MAKRRGKKKRSAPAPVAQVPEEEPKPAPAPKRPPADAPAFWFGFEVSWAKLQLARVVLFGLLAVDALMQIRHAPRYGAGGFNVGQLSIFNSLGPTRGSYELAELVNAYLFVLAACGIATRFVVPAAAAIYAWLYFGSQLDSYQHHYLMSLVLALASFVPWQRPPDATPTTRVRTWALRLILIQLGIMYLWAAISKMSASWVDGRTLAGQIGGVMRHVVDGTVGIKVTAVSVIFVELTLAATVWIPRAWPLAAPLGIAFHAGILLSTLEIGLFAWLMLGIYVLVVPDRIWVWIAEHVRVPRPRLPAGPLRWIVVVVALAGTIVLAAIARFDHALVVACVLATATIAAAIARPARMPAAAIAMLLALVTWTGVDRLSIVATDYYKFWGGTSRRLGEREDAERAYRGLIAIDPAQANAQYQLGRLLLDKTGSEQEGLDHLHVAQELEPNRARPFTAEARWLAMHGRRSEALAKARQALSVEPADPEARALFTALGGIPGAPGAVAPSTPDSSSPAPGIPGTSSLAPGTPALSPGTSPLAPGTQRLPPGTSQLAPGTPAFAPGTPVTRDE